MSQHAIRVVEEDELGRKVKRYVFAECKQCGARFWKKMPRRVCTPANLSFVFAAMIAATLSGSSSSAAGGAPSAGDHRMGHICQTRPGSV
jgi:hypothetical protein